MHRYRLNRGTELALIRADITTLRVDAIVNAANQRMLGGGGVDGAIHRAAGPELRAACAQLPEVAPAVRCPTGQAQLTPGFELAADWVIHTVGPVYRGKESAPKLISAYRSSLALAAGKKLHTIAFPAISCGIYRYPLDEAAVLALRTCQQYAGSLLEIQFALFDEPALDAWRNAAEMLPLEPISP